jgi:cellulose synthase/poly-beta-1,6-N-acetylglucosamine synthase-like glycosyltransferase
MLVVFLSITLVTLLFLSLSWRFENNLNKKKFKAITFPLVSVIIPTYKSAGYIARTIRSVKDSDYPNKEIIVVNDSQDRTTKTAKSLGARVIQNKKRTGKGPALNAGTKLARGELFLFLDSDTVLRKQTISRLVSSMQSYEALGDKVGIIAPRYEARNKRNLLAKLCDMEQNIHQFLLKVQMNFKSILSVRGCCLLVTKQAFQAAGGFSRTLLEDGDFNANVFNAGYHIKYEPRALVKTREPTKLKTLLAAKRRYGKGSFFCALTHKSLYTGTIQSAVCFYPYFLIALAFLGTIVFGDPLLSSIPMLIFFAGISVSQIAPAIMLSLLGILAFAGIVIGITPISAAVRKISLFNAVLPFILFFIPIVTYAYFRGFLSGISDKRKNKSELDFNDW